ncbi:MAG TPA: transglutaminase-like domain-containing protein [Candidatus Limnocylindrales bacterium]
MITRAGAACLCVFFAALSFSPVFAGRLHILLIAGVVVVVGGACIALAYTTVSPTVRVTLAATILVLYSILAVAPGLALRDGPQRLLTAALPVEPRGPELATVVLLVGLAALATVEPAIRSLPPARAGSAPSLRSAPDDATSRRIVRSAPRRRRGARRNRTRPVILALLAPLALAALGCAVGAPAGPPPAWLAAAFSASAAGLLWLSARRRQSSGPFTTAQSPLWLRASGAAVSVAVLAGAGLVAASAGRFLGDADPAQARALIPEPVEPRLDTSPLALFPALRTGRRPLSLSVDTAGEPRRLRLATLDRFDGNYWTTSARYRWAGRNLPGASGTVVEERVQVLRDDGLGWLVSSGRPVYVSVPGLGVDEATGDVVVPAGQAPPGRFTIRSALSPAVSGDSAPEHSTMEAECAPDIADWAKLATGGSHDLAALHRLETHLHDYRRDDRAEAPGGHGLFQIRQLRTARSGTAEQFASAFAVLARCAGFDARVVTGFHAQQVRAGQYTVKGEDVHAWAEVRFVGELWASFDPTPSVVDPSTTVDTPEPTPTPQTQNEPTPPPFTPPSAAAAGPAQALPGPSERAPAVTTTVLTGLALLLAYALAVPLGKSWRRFRRRRSGSPRQRALAAWHDTLDRLTEAALPFDPSDTTGQVTLAARNRFGTQVANPLRDLGLLHDEAAYSAPPGRADLATPAWRLAAQVRGALSARLTRSRRAAARLDPRPLFRRRRD